MDVLEHSKANVSPKLTKNRMYGMIVITQSVSVFSSYDKTGWNA